MPLDYLRWFSFPIQVSYQLKILTTALFSVFMLKKQLSKSQWVALVMLFVGVSLVQLQHTNTSKAKSTGRSQNPTIGFIAVLTSCLCSGFAGKDCFIFIK